MSNSYARVPAAVVIEHAARRITELQADIAELPQKHFHPWKFSILGIKFDWPYTDEVIHMERHLCRQQVSRCESLRHLALLAVDGVVELSIDDSRFLRVRPAPSASAESVGATPLALA